MNKKKLRTEIQDNIAYNNSSLDYIYSTPLTEGSTDFLMQNVNDISFYEDSTNGDLDDLDILDEDDLIVYKFFGVK